MNKLLMALGLTVLLVVPAAAQITPTYTFGPSTIVSVARLNLNFSDMGTAALNRTGGTLTGNLAVGAGVTIDGADISAYLASGKVIANTLGLVTAPAFTFSADGDSGIYGIGANNLGVAVNGTKILDVGTSGLTLVGSLGVTGTRVVKGWFTDLEVTNAIAGSITGNAATASALSANQGTTTTVLHGNAAGTPAFVAITPNDFGTQTANYGLYGPTTGVAATPTFRAAVAADLGVGSITQAYSATLTSVAAGTYAGDDSIVTVGTLTTLNIAATSAGDVLATVTNNTATGGGDGVRAGYKFVTDGGTVYGLLTASSHYDGPPGPSTVPNIDLEAVGTSATLNLISGATHITLTDASGTVFTGAVTFGSASVSAGYTTTGATFDLKTKEASVVANDILGQLRFSAPDDAAGGDANLVAASIVAIAEGTFSATNNATSLSFRTGASEAATEKMKLTSAGVLTVNGFGSHLFNSGGTGQNLLGVTNTTDGTANYATVSVTAATHSLLIQSFPASYTSAGAIVADGSLLYDAGAGGISIVSANAAGDIRFYTGDATLRGTMYDTGGMDWGGPTGGDKGAGTINAKAVYDDGTGPLTDWVFDLAYDGRSDLPIPAGGRLYSFTETETIARRERRLPWMTTRATHEQERSLGAMISRLWFGQEQQQLYLFDHAARLTALERENAALRGEVDALKAKVKD